MIEQSVSLASNGVVKVPGYEQLVRFGYTKNRGVYRLHVDATGEWEGLAIRCFWHVPDGKDPAPSLVVDGYVAVPASVTAQPGSGCITFEGSGGTKTVTSADLRYRVAANSGTEDGTEPEPGTPAWQAFVDAVKESAASAEQSKTEALDAAEQAGASAQKARQALSDTITAKEDALKAIGDKQTTATQAVDTARDKALQQVETSTKAAQTSANEAATSADNANQSAQEAADSLQALKDGIANGDFKGEKGDKGATGPQGEKGDTGPQGPKGDTGPAVALDTTLSIEGKAADAKATGDAIGELKEDIEKLEQSDATAALAETAKKVKAYQKPDSLTIVLMSDTHYASSDPNAAEKLATARLMAKASGVYHVDIVGNLGDLIPGNETLDVSKSDMMAIVGATASNTANRIVVARGNHDDNGWYSQGGYGGSYLPDEMLNALGQYQYVDSMDNGLIRDEKKPDGGYGYFDHEASRIRVFILNTSDIPYVLKEDGSYRYTSYGYAAFSNEQINFVANALKFEDKDVPNDWAALFLMHIPMDTTNEDGYRFGIRDALIRGVTQMLGVITAYKNGSRYQFRGSVYNTSNTNDVQEDFMVSVNVDYSKKGEGDVVGFISGHTHTDNYSNAVGIERSPSRGYHFLSLMGSTSFANFIINRSDNSISVVKHGAVVPDLTEGVSVVAPALGSIESGEWTIFFDQFRPVVVNLFAGWDSAGAGHIYNPDNIAIDLETMELTEHVEDNVYICSKAVPITPLATYKIPADFNGGAIAFNAQGARSGFIHPVAYDGYKTVTSTVSTQYYMVFYAHIPTYADYENMTVELMP